MMPRTRKTRPRPPRGRPAEPRRSNTPVAVDSKEWVFVAVPPLVDGRLFRARRETPRLCRSALPEDIYWYSTTRTKAGLGLVWVYVGSDTSCRDLPVVQSVVMPITARPLAKEARATA